MSRGFFALAGIVALGLGVGIFLLAAPTGLGTVNYEAKLGAVDAGVAPPEPPPPPQPVHVPTPTPVRAIYMSQCVAGTRDFRQSLVDVAKTTEVNAIVIDIKDYSGKIGFTTDNPVLAAAVSDKCRADDIAEFIAKLHADGIYVIGRITVFQDPFMTAKYPDRAVKSRATGGVWKDFKGLSFIDVGAREHWEYIVALSRESYALGFDELNYDYIRYPSDGNMKDTLYRLPADTTKPEQLREFFEYLHTELSPSGVVLSADLFGMTTTNTDDLNIGQVLEKTLPYFDFVAPMVYPSHYPSGFMGYKNPATVPYEIIKHSMDEAARRAEAMGESRLKLRPWLQDFNLGAIYTAEMVRKQKQAVYDAGLDSWMLWAPSNRYTLGALDP